MDDTLKSLTELFTSLANLLPGFIILFLRSRLTGGALPSLKENVALYIVVSAIYYIIFGPIILRAATVQAVLAGYGIRVSVFLLLPAVIGVFLGIMSQRLTITRFAAGLAQHFNLGINFPDSRISSAWDWKFSKNGTGFIIVHLKNGASVQGFLGPQSFVSSDPAQQDIYIERVYQPVSDGAAEANVERGMWIGADEISTIEFISRAMQ